MEAVCGMIRIFSGIAHSTDIPFIGSYELVDTQIDYQPGVDKV